jgi:hypothetical protein
MSYRLASLARRWCVNQLPPSRQSDLRFGLAGGPWVKTLGQAHLHHLTRQWSDNKQLISSIFQVIMNVSDKSVETHNGEIICSPRKAMSYCHDFGSMINSDLIRQGRISFFSFVKEYFANRTPFPSYMDAVRTPNASWKTEPIVYCHCTVNFFFGRRGIAICREIFLRKQVTPSVKKSLVDCGMDKDITFWLCHSGV